MKAAPMTPRLAASVALFLAAALTTAGCGSAEDQGAPVTSLHNRPSMEAVAAELTEVEEQIRAAVTGILPDARWERISEPATSPCTEGGQNLDEARRLFHGTWVADVVPDDAQWTRIRDAVLPILADHGYSDVSMDTSVGDAAFYKVAGQYEGSSFSIQYEKAIAMSFRSGCHIPEGAVEY